MYFKPENLEIINLIALIVTLLSYVWFSKEFWNMVINKQLINLTRLKILIRIFTLSAIIMSINFKTKKMIIAIPTFQLIFLIGTLFSIVGIDYYYKKKNKYKQERRK